MADSTSQRQSLHGQWSTRLAFILAVTGSAVGLGNIWRFPYIAGENGGGAFVLVYLLCIFAIGLPTLVGEILLGRRGRRNPVATMALLGEEEAGSRGWSALGMMGVFGALLILSYYSVIGGWALAYIFEGGSGVFAGADAATVASIFNGISASPMLSLLWHTVFIGFAAWVVALGVERGLERSVRVLMPALVALLLVLLGYAMVEGDFAAGVDFMFEPRFDELSRAGVLEAMGHAFFTLSVGMGALMAYGAYLPDEVSIGRMCIAIVIVDTAVALLASLVIFPIVFANGLDPAAGPGLVFQSLPIAFGRIPAGEIIAVLFFLLLTFAAWTSAISLLEPAVAWSMERFGLSRIRAVTMAGVGTWAVGIASVLSFGPWSGLQVLAGTLFDNLSYLTNNIMLPLGGLAIVVFTGWIMATNSTSEELDPAAGTGYQLWQFGVRFVAPIAIVIVLLHAIGLL